jgi:hypothetical protein
LGFFKSLDHNEFTQQNIKRDRMLSKFQWSRKYEIAMKNITELAFHSQSMT